MPNLSRQHVGSRTSAPSSAQFGVVRIGEPIATWFWIIGFGLLLLACRVKGL